MNTLAAQLRETWLINHRVNLLLLDELTEEALGHTLSKRGGGTVGYQLAHLYNIRFWKLERFDKSLVQDLSTIKAEDVKTKALLRNCHVDSAERIAQLIETSLLAGGQVKGFKRGLIPLIGSFLAHEAHHRGNILLTLKHSGFKLSNVLKYGIWEWNTL